MKVLMNNFSSFVIEITMKFQITIKIQWPIMTIFSKKKKISSKRGENR